jgi:hypothetical protein
MNVPAARPTLIFSAYLLLCLGLAFSAGVRPSRAQSPAGESPVYSVPILVSDFELYSAAPKAARNGKPPGAAPAAKPKPEVPLLYQETDTPPDQAHRLVDYFAMTLVQTLQKNGFQGARRGRAMPAGAQIRGVFAEPDALNRIRRSILGAGSPNAKFLLYVGVFNMARDPQPLYQPATDQPQSIEYGPVITLNNFIPLAKYELDKNPTEEDVQKICNQIVANLVALLQANPAAFSR